ncbi:hypothetical protein BGZ83_007572 [Gryganskiella cystojenkinii]|nr:hypothetical protein BGZ83_007572 [Gryganskiella cystojenkinii]
MGQFTSTPVTPEMAAAIKKRVDELIASNDIVVFSKSYCPYCTKAKNLLTLLEAKFIAIELDNDEQGAAIQAYLLELTDQRTVPNIFISQKHIGGCDSLFALNKSGELKTLLAKI